MDQQTAGLRDDYAIDRADLELRHGMAQPSSRPSGSSSTGIELRRAMREAECRREAAMLAEVVVASDVIR